VLLFAFVPTLLVASAVGFNGWIAGALVVTIFGLVSEIA
jgi:hypothetical protein